MGFVRPDGASRCAWLQTGPRTPVDMSAMMQGPHTLQLPKERPGIMPDVLFNIGNTPLVRINRIAQSANLQCDLFAKCEFFNAGGSVKDRIALRMVEDAEKAGQLKPGDTIIEPTSGNTGIGLALAAAVKGYRCVIVLPEKMSSEKVATLRALGAEIVRTPTQASWDSPESHISVAQRLLAEIPNSIILDQYRNPGNPLAHYDITAEEILAQCGGKVDMVVMGAGTGGTVSGIGRKLKEKCPECVVVGVDPMGSILAEPENLNRSDVTYYDVEGTGYDFIPTVLDRTVVDKWIKSADKESFIMARRLIREEGLLAGGSSGATMACALQAAKDLKPGQKCVALLADGVRNYMTKFLDDNWLVDRGILPMQEGSIWWMKEKVSSISLSSPISVQPNLTVEQTLKIMAQESLNQLTVVSASGLIVGVVTLAGIRGKIGQGEISCNDQIETAVASNFKKVSLETNLRTLSRVLDTDHFAPVVHQQKLYTVEHGLKQMDTLVGMVTDLDLVQYIAHSGRPRSKSGSGQVLGTSSSSSGSSLQSGSSSMAGSPENLRSDCSEELSSDGSAR